MGTQRHILINALAMGGGGGFTVGREIMRNLSIARPSWKVTAAVVAENRLHEEMRSEILPDNCRLFWAPANTIKRTKRAAWERQTLARWADENDVNAVLQLNGMLVPNMRSPTLCHMQDPWPYRPIAWGTIQDRLLAMLKRYSHRKALKNAAAFTWTSDYLRQLICQHHQIWPSLSEVAYNGVPDSWIERVTNSLPPWSTRPNELITVSNVGPYKRHSLVIKALPILLKRPELADLRYRIVGSIELGMKEQLSALAATLGVSHRIHFEGRVSDDELARLYSNAKCFILMSVCESFGIPAIEAMSFGTPVVVADCCAMPEVCGDAAELTPVDDVAALANNISNVILDPGRAEELRSSGATQAAKFRWSPVAERLATVLERIFEKQPALTINSSQTFVRGNP